MPLSIGDKIGHDEVLSLLGQGGVSGPNHLAQAWRSGTNPLLKMPGRGWYAASADGKRFLIAAPVERDLAPLNLVLNWTEELRR